MFKNVASQKITVFAFDSTTNLPKSGDAANITAYLSKDFGTVTALTDTSATEMDATNAKGYYLFDISQTETNFDFGLISAKSSTANIVVVGAPSAIFTLPTTGILAPTVAGRTLDIATTGESGCDFSNVLLPTTGPMIWAGWVESGTAQSATSTTLVGRAATTDDTIKPGMTLLVYGSTQAYWQSVMIDSVSADTFTIAAWPVTTPSGTITYAVLGTPTVSSSVPVPADLKKILGTAVSTPATAGILDINVKNIDNDAASASGTVTFPNATLASTTNITAATGIVLSGVTHTGAVIPTVTTATNVTTVNGLAANVITSASIAADAIGASELAADAVTEIVAGVLTSAMTEAYPTDGSTMTVAQALYLIAQSIGEFSVSGTTVTVKKVDGSTAAATYTLDSSTAPTSRTRAS